MILAFLAVGRQTYAQSTVVHIVGIIAGATPVVVSLTAPHIVRAGYLRLEWASGIGRGYQIQAKDGLEVLEWTNLSFAIPATATNTAVDLPLTGAHRFLRVVEAD